MLREIWFWVGLAMIGAAVLILVVGELCLCSAWG